MSILCVADVRMLKSIKEWIAAFMWAFLFFFIGMVVSQNVVSIVNVKGASMEPTLKQEDRLVLNRLAEPDVGDIVVFPDPDKKGELFIKRVIAKEGDKLRIKDGRLYINGDEYLESYISHSGDDFVLPVDGTGQMIEVPEGSLFVMGDNRNNSFDSRSFGFLPKDEVLGEVSMRFYPFDRFRTDL